MDKPKARLMRENLATMFAEFDKKFDVKTTVGNASFTATNIVFKIEFAEKTADGQVLNREAEAFKRNAKFYGFDADDFGKTFIFRREGYKISGLKPKSYRFPILGTRADGKTFKFPANDVLRALGKKPLDTNADSGPWTW
jgi:hypothetical protein